MIFQLPELLGFEWQGDCELMLWNKVIIAQFKVPWNPERMLLLLLFSEYSSIYYLNIT